MGSRRIVGEPVTWGVWLQQLGSFFLRTKKKFHCKHAAHSANGSRRLEAQGVAGLKIDFRCSRRIVGEPMTWGVWLQRQVGFFLHFKKKWSQHLRHIVQLLEKACSAACCGASTEPTWAHDGSLKSP